VVEELKGSAQTRTRKPYCKKRGLLVERQLSGKKKGSGEATIQVGRPPIEGFELISFGETEKIKEGGGAT